LANYSQALREAHTALTLTHSTLEATAARHVETLADLERKLSEAEESQVSSAHEQELEAVREELESANEEAEQLRAMVQEQKDKIEALEKGADEVEAQSALLEKRVVALTEVSLSTGLRCLLTAWQELAGKDAEIERLKEEHDAKIRSICENAKVCARQTVWSSTDIVRLKRARSMLASSLCSVQN
jgi:chromosome segregation ATPase